MGGLAGLAHPTRMGTLFAAPARGKEIFSFEYDLAWLKSGNAQVLDPSLQLFQGPQYLAAEKPDFGIFLDSAPDRWGRLLMNRREAQVGRAEGRAPHPLHESDYLLGVYDGHRMDALRFRFDSNGPFLDDNDEFASPPWTSLRELEHASLQIECADAYEDVHYAQWLRLLIVPGSSIGGARPKAGVRDEQEHLWIAKFPSRGDTYDLGAWEYLAHKIARDAGITTSDACARKFNTPYSTFLTKRFDRTDTGERLHFASALTLLGRSDGDSAEHGAGYLEMAELLMQNGAQPEQDLEQLWRRIVFSVCISNTDDHLRNHGFLLKPKGWILSPAYDMNPVPHGDGLTLNISDSDNAQDLGLAREAAAYFRIKAPRAKSIITEIVTAVRQWRKVAAECGIPAGDQARMQRAFRIADSTG